MAPESPKTTPERVEELFKFDLGKVSLEPGERLTRSLFSSPSEHTTFFRVALVQLHQQSQQLAGTRQLTVTRILRLENKSSHAWTHGLCVLMRDGIMFARTDMPFTAPGKHAGLALGSPEDIEASWTATETHRESVPDPYVRNVLRTRITVASNLVLVNNRNEAVMMEVVADLHGDVLDPGDGEVTISGFDQYAINRRSIIKWRVSVAAESTHTVQFLYRAIR
jgi:hypothetical protein